MIKPIDLSKPVSGREFARMVGQAESAVRKAHGRGSIKKGRTATGRYLPLVASREWGKQILPEIMTAAELFVAPEPVKPAKTVKPAAAKKPKAAAPKPAPPVPATAEDFVNEDDDEGGQEEEPVSGPLTEDSPKHEAERRTAIFKAKTAELLYQEKKGEMIPRSKMRVLYEYGSQIRSAFEALPDRVIDDILAVAEDRQAAKRILVEAIHNTLTGLSDPEKLNL